MKWLGSWGGGIVTVSPDNAITLFNAGTGHIAGVSEDINFSVVSDIAVDYLNTVWILNYRAVNDLPLIGVDRNLTWVYPFQRNEAKVNTLTIDSENQKWIGSEDEGIFIFNDNGTPADIEDDFIADRITRSNGLATNTITALKTDLNGIIWIGTSQGLYYFDDQLWEWRYFLPTENITALAVDGANNLWMGSNTGLVYLNTSTLRDSLITRENSGLVDNDVKTLQIDYESGKLYIGTSHGLSILQTPYSLPEQNLENLVVYPNPFIPNQHEQLTIENLSDQVSVYIYSSGGYLIRHYLQNDIWGKRIDWDGKNQNGESVASGIYFIIIQSDLGEFKKAKVVLIR